MAHDLVIRNGTVVDGSGFGSYRADVGIAGDRIVEVGRIGDPGRREIDADGHVVTPGFIDGHTHMDAQVFWDATGANSCWHGVTSVVMGNCGFTLAPVRSDQRELVVRNLERAEDIDPAALAAGIDWSFETFPEYLDAVDCLAKGINFAANIGHSALRTWAMGERAFEGEATEDDLELMCGQLAEALRAGAIGFSTSRTKHHETSDGRPVASRMASWDEVAALVGVMGRLGSGIFEGADADMSAPDPEVRADGLDRMTSLAAATGVPMTFGLIATRGAGYLIDFLDDAAARGARMIAQTHCRGISVLLSLKTRLPFDLIPAWSDLRSLPVRRAAAHPRRPGPAGPLRGRGGQRRLRGLHRRGGPGPATGLRGDPGLPTRPAPQPVGGRRRP